MLETGLSSLFIKTLKLQVDYILVSTEYAQQSLTKKKAALQAIQSKTGWLKKWIGVAEHTVHRVHGNRHCTR